MRKEFKLMVKWSKKEKDFMIYYPHKSDGSFISWLIKPFQFIHPSSMIEHFLNRSTKEICCYRGVIGKYSLLETDWINELEARGYDKTSLKFEITVKVNKIKEQFPHLYELLSEKEKKKYGI